MEKPRKEREEKQNHSDRGSGISEWDGFKMLTFLIYLG